MFFEGGVGSSDDEEEVVAVIEEEPEQLSGDNIKYFTLLTLQACFGKSTRLF